MGGHAGCLRTGGDPAVTASPRLLELLERDELDWSDPRQREAYLKAWVRGDVKPYLIRPWSEVQPGVTALHKGVLLKVTGVSPAAAGKVLVTAVPQGAESPREYEIPGGHLTAVAAKET
jgi:hypothetical protein